MLPTADVRKGTANFKAGWLVRGRIYQLERCEHRRSRRPRYGLGSRISVETKFFGSHTYYVTATEQLGVARASTVDEHTIGAEVTHEVAGRRDRDLGVVSGDGFAGDDNVAPRIAANSEARMGHAVFATVDERYHASAGCGGARAIRGGHRCRRRTERRHQHSAACLTIIGEAELTPGHLDPVSVKQWRWLGTKRHTIH
jgi:hypothetical protein